MIRLLLLSIVVGVFALVITLGFALTGGGLRALAPGAVLVGAVAGVVVAARRR
ncbi:MAG TPA: hypothetical protein VG184_10250 [Acidimicrobiales bacterium]|jgi:hypothetical protein|nr:hypothetical protein [Acidimicrobiales bacterium]